MRWDDTVEMIMSQPPITVGLDARLEDVARIMYDNRIGSVIVVDEEGTPIGIFTRTDLVYTVASGSYKRNPKISDVMRSEPVVAKRYESIRTAYARMKSLGMGHLPVVDDDDRVIGVVSMKDILLYVCGFE